MLTADLPFQSDSVLQAMYQRVTLSPKNPKTVCPDLPDYLVNIIMRCLEKGPEQRYQHARDILADLDRGESAAPAVTPAPAPAAAAPRSRKTALWAVAAVIVIAAVLILALPKRHAWFVSKNAAATATAPAGKYIAILPFRVLGDEASLRYTADGIVEALSAKLFQLKDVHLAASAQRINPNDPPEQLARSLGAKLLVQGSVQGSGDQLRLVVNLDDVSDKTGRRLWSKEFSGLKQDLLTLQDQVYDGVISALDLRLTTDERAKTTVHLTENLSAYELYLKGVSLLRNGQRDDKTLKEALDYFDAATQKDRNFAKAYTGMADTAVYLYNIKKDASWATRALEAANRARTINNNIPEVHFSLGQVFNVTGKSAEAVEELQRALELAPNSDDGYRRLGLAYKSLGKKAEALQAFQHAIDANPFYWFNYNALGNAYFEFGDNDQALKAFQHVTELAPNLPNGWTNVGGVQFQLGKWNESIAAFRKALEIQPSVVAYSNIGTSFFFQEKYDEARVNFEKAVQMSPQRADLVGNLADCYRWLGQRDKASTTYDRAIELSLQSLRTNPRDADALSDLGVFYAKKGDTEKGLDYIRRAREVNPAVNFFYKETVINTLSNRLPEALQSLKEALTRGSSVREAFSDPELKVLRERPEFPAMVKPFLPKP
jgi:tetratricopeptide (TPR) repeat protein